MDLAISVVGAVPGCDARSLLDWLRRDRKLRARVELATDSPSPNQLGALTDTLSVVLGPGGVGVALVAALSVWLRGCRTDVTVRIEGPRGVVELDVRRARNVDDILAGVHRIVHEERIEEGFHQPRQVETLWREDLATLAGR